MKELNDIATTKLATMIDDGSIEKIIEIHLENLLEETVSSAIQKYSNFGKSLTSTIENSIGTSISQVSFPEYNQFVAQLIQEKYGQALDQHAAPLLENLLNNNLNPIPDELNARAILDEIKGCWEENAHENGGKIDIEWKESDSAIYMTIKHPEFDSNTLKVTFCNHSEKNCQYHIGYIKEGDKRISDSITAATHAMGLAGYFYKMYCRQTKIIGLKDICGEQRYA